jgi:alcohol dehydrogenase class IV
LAAEAHAIRRLMDNNPRDMSVAEVEAIYRAAF